MGRIIFYLMLFFVLPTVALGQSVDEFKTKLAQPVIASDSISEPIVTVREYGRVAEVVAKAAKATVLTKISGYRLCIFLDNGENARVAAVEAKEQFELAFPDEKTYIAYENPYFKVTVGNCITSEEGIILMGLVSTVFPKAFLKNEDISLQDILDDSKVSGNILAPEVLEGEDVEGEFVVGVKSDIEVRVDVDVENNV